jgi:5-methylcytosine-specific restriction endonuclease McrA
MTLGESIIATCNAARNALLAAYRAMPYSDYLATDHWLSIRAAAMYRAGGRCQLCGNGHQQRLQIHHNTYENLGQERPEDLIVLCQSCHEKYHNKSANGGSSLAAAAESNVQAQATPTSDDPRPRHKP